MAIRYQSVSPLFRGASHVSMCAGTPLPDSLCVCTVRAVCEAKRNPTDDGTSDVRRWLAGVAEIATAVNAPVPLPVLLDLVAEKACTLMGYELCAVLLANDSRDALVIEGSYGLTPEYVARVNTDHPIRLGPGPLGEGPSSRAFNSGEPQAIDDITVEPMFRPWGRWRASRATGPWCPYRSGSPEHRPVR